MGWKDDRLEEDQLRGIAETIGLRTGLLTKCPVHEEVFDSQQGDLEAAYKLGNHLISTGDPLVEPFQGNRRKLTDLIKDVCSDFGNRCPLCAKNADS